MPPLEVHDLHKSFGSQRVLDGVNLTVEHGETVVVLGRSGTGKSVLLKHIVGLLRPDEGQIIFDGQQIDNQPEDSDEDDYHVTGTLYSLTKPLARPGKPGPEWNTMEITLDGPHTMVSVNGVKVTDYTEGDPVPPMKYDFEPQRGPRPEEGYMGLQNHSKDDVVFFKEVAIKSLKK